ncbi:hypothetical protein [Streptomyces albogriseolus]|uniref:hypothetical protein n=1 Tax=Streptomyces albogriseolus TaxID=1887 RepID=UPI00225AFDA8|nr:hypothetical protein [Streptomyces viridodiastaticus]MCX4622838.1 hypothetical protein [Streptomyces viridodiastaticus]
MEQATHATTTTTTAVLGPDRRSYERARELADRVVGQVPTLPNAAEVHRSFALDTFEARLHFGAGLTAGRGVLETAALTDAEVTREDKHDDRGQLSGVWIGVRTVVDGVPLSAWALASEADADQLLHTSPAPADADETESDTEVTQPLPTVGTGPGDVVIPAVIPVTPLAAPSSADSGDGCPRNVIDGDVGSHLYKHGAFVDGPMRCMYCGGAKPEDGGTPKVAPLSAKAQEPEAGE